MEDKSTGSDSGFPNTIDKYELGEVLGSGGFAIVYRATVNQPGDAHDQKQVAVKVINKRKMREDDMTVRVANEVKIHWVLEHPCILRLHNFFEDNENVYLVTEYCKGGELNKYIKQKFSKDESFVQHIFAQIVLGTIYLHSHGILHRDLKLNNILLGSDNIVKIADFGLSVRLNDIDSKQDTICGTPNYISPEIMDYKPYGLPADMWSLGCILVALLTGDPPFDGMQSVKSYSNTQRLYELPNVSKGAQNVVNALLKPEPRLRVTAYDLLRFDFVKSGISKLDKSILNFLPDSCFEILIQQEPENIHELYQSREELDKNNTPLKHKSFVNDSPALSDYRTPLQAISINQNSMQVDKAYDNADFTLENKENVDPSFDLEYVKSNTIKMPLSIDTSIYSKYPLMTRWTNNRRPYGSQTDSKKVGNYSGDKKSDFLQITTVPLKAFQRQTKYGVVTLHEDKGWISFYFKDDRTTLLISPHGTIIKIYSDKEKDSNNHKSHENTPSSIADTSTESYNNSSAFMSMTGFGTPTSPKNESNIPINTLLFSKWVYLTQNFIGSFTPTNLPNNVKKQYKYACKFINLLLSKTSYMKFSNDILEVSLMCDSPVSLSFKFSNGIYGIYIKSRKQLISVVNDNGNSKSYSISGSQLDLLLQKDKSSELDINLPKYLISQLQHFLQMAKICYEYENDRNTSLFANTKSEPEEDNFPTPYITSSFALKNVSPYSNLLNKNSELHNIIHKKTANSEISPINKSSLSFDEAKSASEIRKKTTSSSRGNDFNMILDENHEKDQGFHTMVNTPIANKPKDSLKTSDDKLIDFLSPQKDNGLINSSNMLNNGNAPIFMDNVGWCVRTGQNYTIYFNDGLEMIVLTHEEKVIFNYNKTSEDLNFLANHNESQKNNIYYRIKSEEYDLYPPLPDKVKTRLSYVPKFFNFE